MCGAAPWAAITGCRMRGLGPAKATRLSSSYPLELARAVHFPTMIFFVFFVITHVAMVFATGALRNLNHMFAGTDTTNWAGFWIFVGAPYIEWITAQPRLQGALTAITAAVVGVILNLAVWFGLHVFFGEVSLVAVGPLKIWSPTLSTLDWRIVALPGIRGVLLLPQHRGTPPALAVAAPLHSQADADDGSLRWRDCVVLAQSKNPEIISANEKINQAAADRGIARSDMLPSVSASLAASRSKREGGAESAEGTRNSFSYGIEGGQLLFDGGRAYFETKGAGSLYKKAVYGKMAASASVRLAMRTAFNRLLSAQESVGIVKEITDLSLIHLSEPTRPY